MMTSNQQTPTIPNGMKFLFGGSAGMGATVFVQPLDLVKNRMQVVKVKPGGERPTSLNVLSGVIRNEGFFTLYRGLSAGLLRQATYTTARLGIFKTITEEAKKMNEGKPLPLWQKAVCGLTAGGLGSLVGSP